MSQPPGEATTPHQRIAADPEFKDLRNRFGKFIFPMVAIFIGWYFVYVLLAVFAPSFMATSVIGNINIGLVLGLLQFVSTFAITFAYRRWANNVLDPAAEKFKSQLEKEMNP